MIAFGSVEFELEAKQERDAAYTRANLGSQATVLAQRSAVIRRGERLQLFHR
ncbi:hypothetical protein D3C71_2000660 [compost metagenome]